MTRLGIISTNIRIVKLLSLQNTHQVSVFFFIRKVGYVQNLANIFLKGSHIFGGKRRITLIFAVHIVFSL